MIKRESSKRGKEKESGEISLFLLAPTVIPAKLKLPKEVSFALPPPPLSRQPTHSPYPTVTYLIRISCALHFGSASFSRQALLCLLPTNQPAKSCSDVAPTDKWSALGLPACGHYWSMRFSVLLPSFSRHFFTLLFFISSFVPHLFPSSLRCPIFPTSPSLHAHIYILFYVTLPYYLSHFPGIPIRS